MSTIELTNYDYSDLKDSLITFLQGYDDRFKDFNFEGSNINTLISILSRNSHYLAYMANMTASESFLDTAQLIANVISHAQDLSYVPRSCTAAQIVCSIETTPSSTPDETSIELTAGSSFLASIDNTSYTFTNIDSWVLPWKTSRGTFKATDVTLYQGTIQTNKLIYSGSRIKIPNKRIDTSTLTVSVAETSSATPMVYTAASEIQDLGADQNVYFLSMNTDGYYVIEFGKDILGIEPANASIVTCSYIVVEDTHANGLAELTAASMIGDYSNTAVTVTTSAYGGAEADDIETIRFLAPKAYEAQNRCVTPDDYIVKLREKYSFIKHAAAWGGDEMDPPQYGSVIISCIASGQDFISTYVKNEMVSFLTGYNVGSITPVIIDPVLVGIDLTVKFGYDRTKTSKSFTQIAADVVTYIQSYSDSDLNDFDQYYNNSTLISGIRDITGVTTVELDKSVFTSLDLVKSTSTKYEFTFGNEITPGTVSIPTFTVNSSATSETIVDDSNGNIILTQVIAGTTYKQTIGAVDYTDGSLYFTTTFVNDADYIQVYVECVDDNVYLGQNKIGYINLIDTQQISV